MKEYKILTVGGALASHQDLEDKMNKLADEDWTVTAVVAGKSLPVIIMEKAKWGPRSK